MRYRLDCRSRSVTTLSPPSPSWLAKAVFLFGWGTSRNRNTSLTTKVIVSWDNSFYPAVLILKCSPKAGNWDNSLLRGTSSKTVQYLWILLRVRCSLIVEKSCICPVNGRHCQLAVTLIRLRTPMEHGLVLPTWAREDSMSGCNCAIRNAGAKNCEVRRRPRVVPQTVLVTLTGVWTKIQPHWKKR